jgi:hypothetical protein
MDAVGVRGMSRWRGTRSVWVFNAGGGVETPRMSQKRVEGLLFLISVDSYAILTSRFHARSTVLDQVFVPDTKPLLSDLSTAPSPQLFPWPKGQTLDTHTHTQYTTGDTVSIFFRFTGDGMEVEIENVTFPVLNVTNDFWSPNGCVRSSIHNNLEGCPFF